jgi:hypothetical protein
MSIFGDILDRILGRPSAPSPTGNVTAGGPTIAPSSRAPTTPMAPAAVPTVDIVAVLTAMAAKNPQKLDWRQSIVDLMKLLGIDSSLASRKQLAKELGYSGDMNESASMNVWLHKQVMQNVAANGGRVPDELK